MASFILKGLITNDGIDRLRNGNQLLRSSNIYLSYIHLHLYTSNQYADICIPFIILVFPNNKIAWTNQFIHSWHEVGVNYTNNNSTTN